MIDRYTRPEMAALWTKQKKFETWLEVELNATDAWVKLGKVPAEAAAAMRKNAKFTVERVEEIEQSTRHDVVAFTRCVAESLGDESKYLHFASPAPTWWIPRFPASSLRRWISSKRICTSLSMCWPRRRSNTR